MKRRVVLASVAGAAWVAGAGSALWQRRRADPAEETVIGDIWSQSLETLAGARLAMRDFRGRPLLLNFWATWCPPCVSEMPMLDGFAHEQSGRWHVLALAVDKKESVRRFLTERGLSLSVAFATTIGIDLSRSLGNRLGTLPFTAVFAANGSIASTKLGPLQPELLAEWVGKIR